MFLNPRMTGFMKSVREGTVKEAARVGSWVSAIEIIKENPLLGVGLQHAEREMAIQYSRLGFEDQLKLNLNAHNQFLETALVTGVVGLAVLLSIFFLVLKRAFQHRDVLLFLVVSNLAFHCCVESMISRFHGIIFFSFIFLILYLSSRPVVPKSKKVPQRVIS
jgi:O-antigen ligase